MTSAAAPDFNMTSGTMASLAETSEHDFGASLASTLGHEKVRCLGRACVLTPMTTNTIHELEACPELEDLFMSILKVRFQ